MPAALAGGVLVMQEEVFRDQQGLCSQPRLHHGAELDGLASAT